MLASEFRDITLSYNMGFTTWRGTFLGRFRSRVAKPGMLYDIHFLSLCVKVRVEDNEQNKIFDFLGGNLTDFTLIQ
jgi:hypothetical protein